MQPTLRWNRNAVLAALMWLSACAHQQKASSPPSASAPAPAAVAGPTSAPARAGQKDNASQQPPAAATAAVPASRSAQSSPPPTAESAPSTLPPTPVPAPATATVKKVARPAAATASKPTGPAATAATETLDLKSLEQRLRDTHAIGVFTKLSLKNQVDDLLTDLRAFHGGQPNPPLAELRQSYESLLVKVISVLQSGDPKLASAVSSSRDALWALLSDPKKFSEIT
jgi:hypothetical protein